MKEQLVYRMTDLTRAIGLGKTKIYEMIKEGEFPRPIELGSNSVGWLVEDVKDWVKNRPRRTVQ